MALRLVVALHTKDSRRSSFKYWETFKSAIFRGICILLDTPPVTSFECSPMQWAWILLHPALSHNGGSTVHQSPTFKGQTQMVYLFDDSYFKLWKCNKVHINKRHIWANAKTKRG